MSNKLKKETNQKKKKKTNKNGITMARFNQSESEKKGFFSKFKKDKAQEKTIEEKVTDNTSVTEPAKVVTNYDKKIEKRKKQAQLEKRSRFITKIVSTIVVAAIVTTLVVTGISTYYRINKKYIVLDDKNVNQIEFDFYYNLLKNNTLNQTLYGDVTYLSYFKSYMGYDPTKKDSAQSYSATEYTWYDYFANNAVQTMKEYKALLKAADEKGFDYTKGDEDYNTFTDELKKAADEANESLSDYYKKTFGDHASSSKLKKYVYEYLKASAYQEELESELTPSTEEIENKYNDNKEAYDTVDYRSFQFKATEASDAESMAQQKSKAEAMAANIKTEADFIELCKKNASDDDATKYADDSASLTSGGTSTSMTEALSDWMYGDRKAADVGVIEDTTNGIYTVAYFISRQKPADTDENIKSSLINENYSNFIKAYTDKMSFDNVKNRIKMYTEEG